MANTLKFGTDGQWATKVGSTLAYNDEGGNFKPLPFNFTRSTSATRVNKDGLIEVVTNNKPRIDFLNDSNGALLLEPSRTNLITYSEAFDNGSWVKTRATVTSNATTSPDGTTTADKFIPSVDNNTHIIEKAGLTVTAQIYTATLYAKKAEYDTIRIVMSNYWTPVPQASFNLTTKTTFNVSDATAVITELSDGWFKLNVIATVNPLAGGNGKLLIYAGNDGEFSLTGDGTSGVYIWGAQLEAGSYATSYIPTQGAIATRVGEVCEQNLSNQVSLTEGVVYIDTTNLGNDGTNSNIISQNSVVDTVYCIKVGSNNKIACGLFASSVNIPINSTSAYPLGTRTKIAFHYKSGNSKLYINGSLDGTNNDSFTLGSGFATALRLIDASSAYNAYPQKSIVREFKVYNSGLTDAELIALTTI